MRQITLTRGMVALVDDEDYDRVVAVGSWCAQECDGRFYARHSARRPNGSPYTESMHTFLTGWPLVDHANGDGLDNRRSNLRSATQSLNNANARRPVSNTSGFKGVSLYTRTGRWRATIGESGRARHLGYFDTAEEAARAYDRAAVATWGEFARLNFQRQATQGEPMSDVELIDIGNWQMVGSGGRVGTICVMAPRMEMERQEALVHAAWIVALADRGGGPNEPSEFDTILQRVRNT